MKIIDLLNKIANREEVPKKIKYKSIVLCYHEEDQDYGRYFGSYLFEHLFKMYDTKSFINDEVKVIEEPKKIEKLNEILRIDDLQPPYNGNIEKIWVNIIIQQNKLNEIIDHINSKEDK